MIPDRTAGRTGNGPRGGVRYGRWVFGGFAAIAVYFVVAEHRAHALQFLPYALLLACPLLHLFHGHGGHGKDKGSKQ